jgi:hypothetical protein
MNHAPEPWKRIDEITLDGDGLRIVDQRPIGDEDLDRAIACVNACAGIPDQDGKITLVGDMILAILNNDPAELATVKGRILEILEVNDES